MIARFDILAALALGAAMTTAIAAPPLTVTTVAENIVQPHVLVFLPNGDALIGEAGGRILVLRDGRVLDTPIANSPAVQVTLLGGLVDFVPAPDFTESAELFISYTKGTGGPWSLVVARAKLIDGALQDIRTIFELAPIAGEYIWGGHMVFLKDGSMLVFISDGGDTRAHAQRRTMLLGKVLRLDRDGKPLPDNPFVAEPTTRPEIYTLGHRHMIGLVYDPVQDLVYANENGPYGGDEINVLRPGRNYGWPIATYGKDYSGAYVSPFQTYPGMEPPILTWVPSIAPSGMAQCRGCQWPEWEGDLITGALSGKKVMRVKVDGEKVIEQEALFVEMNKRFRDVAFGPDGALYLLTDEPKGKLLKVTRGAN
jgi:glucose/arabinose dehydrogenase